MKDTITIKVPSIEDIVFNITCEEEYDSPDGYFDTGDDKLDKKIVSEINKDLNDGNSWAWCCVKVSGEYRGLSSDDYLGGCSYKSQKDFEDGGYYDDMKETVYRGIVKMIESLAK